MKKIWDFILRFRFYILIIILVLFFIFVFVTMKAYLDPVNETIVYGNRLDGIEKAKVEDEFKNELVKFIKEDESVTEAKVDVRVKIINVIIYVNNKDNTQDKMKEKSNKILEKFSKELLSFYDIQFYVKNEDANYIMIGYKNSSNESISWVSDELVKSEVEKNEEKQ